MGRVAEQFDVVSVATAAMVAADSPLPAIPPFARVPGPYIALMMDRLNIPGMEGANWTYGAMYLYHVHPTSDDRDRDEDPGNAGGESPLGSNR